MTELLEALQETLGPSHVLTGAEAAPALIDPLGLFQGRALAVVRPADSGEVAAVVRLCRDARVPIVPQGGNTGLVGAATPDASGRAVVLSLGRLNRIRAIDPDNDTLTVEAGCVVAQVQAAAEAAGRLFPLSLGSEGSCTIGGTLATNAGGLQVLRYGTARDLALGLEVVTAEGEIWDGLRGLRKDNTGYRLRDLYIGSEGTLGVITAATLKLFPRPASRALAFVSLPSLEAAVAFLAQARLHVDGGPSAFEIISRPLLDLVSRHAPEERLPPLGGGVPWFALLEVSSTTPKEGARAVLEEVTAAALDAGLVVDAVVAQDLAQEQALWRLREHGLGAAMARQGRTLKHDVSLPLSRIPAFMSASAAALRAQFGAVRPLVFGHLGDGNLHYNVAHDPAQSIDRLVAQAEAIHQLIHDMVHAHQGSISAEHGIGQRKRDQLPRYKSALELSLMSRLKQALDPLSLMNPGKVLP
ncbi:FAD-binding oxidoreductase [Pararhodospirillum photometricum]|nr:FAD-binding oxidoreductase [Pararhodospirillum photometricum]